MAIRFTRLTRPAIRALAPGEKITESGITAERLSNGDTRYVVNIMAAGQRVHRVIGLESDGTTRSQCEEFIAKTWTEAKEGRLSLPRGRATPLTFKAAAKIYLERQERAGAKNLDAKGRHVKLHLNPYFGTMRLERITSFTTEKFRRHCQEHDLAPATINRILATYRHMARRLYEWKMLREQMPVPKLEAEDNHREYVLSADEEDLLLAAALADSNTYVWLFIKMALGSALRHSEILSASFDRFDVDRRRIRVRVKGGRWRDQPLTKELTDILAREREMPQDQKGWVFPSTRSDSGHLMNLNRVFRRCVGRAGLDPSRIVPHTLRHTAITRISEAARGDVATVKKFSGHKSIQMVMRYTHPEDRLVDEALDRMEKMGTKREQKPVTRRRFS